MPAAGADNASATASAARHSAASRISKVLVKTVVPMACAALRTIPRVRAQTIAAIELESKTEQGDILALWPLI